MKTVGRDVASEQKRKKEEEEDECGSFSETVITLL